MGTRLPRAAFQLAEQPPCDGPEELRRGPGEYEGYLSAPAEHAGAGSIKAYIRNIGEQETPLVAAIETLRLVGRGTKAIAGVYNRSLKILIGPKLADWLEVPNMTTQGLIAMIPSIEVKERAQKLLLEHNLFDTSQLPKGERGTLDNCPLANVLGGEIEARTLLSLDFLEPMERLMLMEFFERFDRGDYPELEQKK